MYDILIVGAGCAGLTAALYAARDGKKVLVLEGESVGGQIAYSPRVENYPGIGEISGLEFSDALMEQAMSFGAQMDFENVTELQKCEHCFIAKSESGKTFEAKSVILALGAKSRRLGVEGEDKLSGKGVSYCAICDGPFYTGKNVAVVGGGSSALQSAIMLSGICGSVSLIHRRRQFRGETVLAQRALALPNVTPFLDCTVSSLSDSDKLQAVILENKETGEKREIPCDCLFVCIGKQPNNGLFESLAGLDSSGYFASGEDCKTKTEGLFVAGDCRAKQVRQLTTAAADGSTAALAALEYLTTL